MIKIFFLNMLNSSNKWRLFGSKYDMNSRVGDHWLTHLSNLQIKSVHRHQHHSIPRIHQTTTRTNQQTTQEDAETYEASSKGFCILPRVKGPKSPPRFALLQSLSRLAYSLNTRSSGSPCCVFSTISARRAVVVCVWCVRSEDAKRVMDQL